MEYEVDEQGWVFFEVNGFGWVYIPSETHGQLMHQRLLITPEQAIAATLGRGECENVITDGTGFKCSKCQAHISAWILNEFPRFSFCPNCGAEVIA